jgi:hypothetical protein
MNPGTNYGHRTKDSSKHSQNVWAEIVSQQKRKFKITSAALSAEAEEFQKVLRPFDPCTEYTGGATYLHHGEFKDG